MDHLVGFPEHEDQVGGWLVRKTIAALSHMLLGLGNFSRKTFALGEDKVVFTI